MDQQSGFKAVIIGASGAVGRELVQELCKSPKWSKIHLIVRRQLDAWKTIEGYEKLSYQKMDTFDPLE